MKLLFPFLFFWIPAMLVSQGIIRGNVSDMLSNEPIPGATIILEETETGTATNMDGNFELNDVPNGFHSLRISAIGYETRIIRDIQVNNQMPAMVNIKLKPSVNQLEGIEIRLPVFSRTDETPLSMRTIGIAEIERNPGGNRDISNVLRSFPGVGSTPAARNDIIIRGGSPSENRYFLDGVEVPVINHFQTQGASGGPVGIMNVNLIREVDFISGAFPANRGNALSSVLEFRQVEGNRERWQFRGTLGSSDAGIKADGPIGQRSSLIASVRASYLQFLFAGLQLPFLPTYYDAQFKYVFKPDANSDITVLGLGAIDLFSLNMNANKSEDQRYLLGVLPVNKQWNYTLGATYRRYSSAGTHFFVISRNMLNNSVVKYADNIETPENLILDFHSQESENRFRYEFSRERKQWQLSLGINAEHARFTNRTYNRIYTPAGLDTIRFDNQLNLLMGGLFGQVSRRFFNEKLSLSAGFRLDNNSYNSSMANPFRQFSPRFSASWNFYGNFSLNASVGRYYQRPAYTLMGYSDEQGNYLNQDRLTYIRCDHLNAGLEWAPGYHTRISVEGFWKSYADYPFSLRDSVSMANLGTDYGVIGNVEAQSAVGGRARGFEILVHQKLYKGFYGILAYTFVNSEFEDLTGKFIPSAWDSRHIITLTAGYKVGRNWEIGMRWRYVDGMPYTPYDTLYSMIKTVWDVNFKGKDNVSQLNALRMPAFHQLDIRVDKVWYFKKWSLNLYLDIQNLYGFKAENRPYLSVETDAAGQPLTDPSDPNRYLPKFIPSRSGTILPSIGVIIDF